MKQKIAIIAPAKLPIPPTRGGAVEELVYLIVLQNEVEKKIDLTIISVYDKDAYKRALSFKHTKFVWLKSTALGLKIRNRILRHIYLPLKKEPFYNYWQYKIITHLKQGNYDKVVLESNADFVNILGEKIGKDKLFCHMHILPKMQNGTFENCNKVLAVSEYIRQEIIKETNKPSDCIAVLKNSINEENFKSDSVMRMRSRLALNLSPTDVAICFVGRLVKLKGVEQLIEAFIRVSHPNAKLFIIGSMGGNFKDGDYKTQFVTKLVTMAEGRKDIIFTGFVDNHRLSDILVAMDIAVMPSFYKEAAGVNNIEYQAMGLPLITTNSGGILEYVSEKAIILQPDANLVYNLAEKLNFLINNLEERRIIGEAGKLYSNQFTKSHYYKSFISLIQ